MPLAWNGIRKLRPFSVILSGDQHNLHNLLAFEISKRQILTVQMITRLYSATLRGVDAQEVEVEVNARGADKPMVIIMGKTLFSS